MTLFIYPHSFVLLTLLFPCLSTESLRRFPHMKNQKRDILNEVKQLLLIQKQNQELMDTADIMSIKMHPSLEGRSLLCAF